MIVQFNISLELNIQHRPHLPPPLEILFNTPSIPSPLTASSRSGLPRHLDDYLILNILKLRYSLNPWRDMTCYFQYFLSLSIIIKLHIYIYINLWYVPSFSKILIRSHQYHIAYFKCIISSHYPTFRISLFSKIIW